MLLYQGLGGGKPTSNELKYSNKVTCYEHMRKTLTWH